LKYINRHSIVLFVILVAIGFGLFTMMGFQRKNAFAPVAATTGGGGLVINVLPGGVAPTSATDVNTDNSNAGTTPVVEEAPADSGATCP
jgi:hypothetical protein